MDWPTGMLSTQRCAETLNTLYASPDTFDADYIRREIKAGRLHARINISAGRQRARLRVHADDFQAYAKRFHAAQCAS